MIKTENSNNPAATPVEYLSAAKSHLSNGRKNEAFMLLQRAVLHYPEDPYIVSYYGLLQSTVGGKDRAGLETCKRALGLLSVSALPGEETLYPGLYLNLSRAYAATGKKKDAIDALRKGLKYDPKHSDILKDLRTMGTRKKPPLPFLDRSNPINKYIGIIMKSLTKDQKRKE